VRWQQLRQVDIQNCLRDGSPGNLRHAKRGEARPNIDLDFTQIAAKLIELSVQRATESDLGFLLDFFPRPYLFCMGL
jgi:hypothetical protein